MNTNIPDLRVESATERLSEPVQGAERRPIEVQALGRGKKRNDQTEGNPSLEPSETVGVSTESGKLPRRSVRKRRKVVLGEEKGEDVSEGGPKNSGVEGS